MITRSVKRLLLGVVLSLLFFPSQSAAESEVQGPGISDAPRMGSIPGSRLTHDESTGTFRISEVNPGSKAEEFGLREGDHIVAIDGERLQIDSNLAAVAFYDEFVAGEKVELTLLRGGEEVEVQIVPSPMPVEFEKRIRAQRAAFEDKARRQDVLNWIQRTATEGTFVIRIEALGNQDFDVRVLEVESEAPHGLADWLLRAHYGHELRAMAKGERRSFRVSREPDGRLSFDTIPD